MSEISSCHKCGGNMLAADHRDESVEQDGMCISCRDLLEQCREEEATASFCQYHSNAIAEWHTEVLTKCGFTYERRIPEDINQTCMELHYAYGIGISLIFTCIEGNFITLRKENTYTPTLPDWNIRFGLSTPVPVILATIKAAVEHEAK